MLTVLGLVLGCGASEVGFGNANYEANPGVANDVSRKKFAESGEIESVLGAKHNRYVIYDANVDLEVADFSIFSKRLPSLVSECGGYIAAVNINHVRTSRRGTWQVRIQSNKFDEFFRQLGSLGQVGVFHQKAHDVTSEFVDLKARIVNKKKMESRVLELIGESNRTLKDVIGLEKELARIRGEVERMQGKMNQLENQTEFAKITIIASECRPVVVAVVPTFWKRVGDSWRESFGLLKDRTQDMTVSIVYLFPWLVLLGIAAIPIAAIYLVWSKRAARGRLSM